MIVRSARRRGRAPGLALCTVLPLGLAGCQKEKTPEPEIPWGLPIDGPALVKLGPGDPKPSFAAAFSARGRNLDESLAQSLSWFQKPSSKQFFPQKNGTTAEDVATWEQASAGVVAFRQILAESSSATDFQTRIEQVFDIWQSVGKDGTDRQVLFTGYYSPEFKGSRTRSGRFQHPLHRRPADLVTDPVTGEPKGRRLADGSVVSYATRGELARSGELAGAELVWLESSLDAYIIQVNGSARITMPDGSNMFVGYAGKTDRPYVGLGRSMVDAGLLTEDRLSLASIRSAYRKDPAVVEALMERNESYVFFTEYDGSNWPAGSLGVRVTEGASIATDKKIFPRGGVTLVNTRTPTISRGPESFSRFMLDQDTGGAITAADRADLYMGIGATAEILAGGQYFPGSLYYLILKPEYVGQYPLPEVARGAAVR
jgi:membrane-bound lytic murein transglycosylase A